VLAKAGPGVRFNEHIEGDERLDVMSAVIGIKQGLPQPPGGKAQETGSDDGNEDVAEGLRQERAQRVLGIDCLVMGPHRRQDRKHPENQEHDPPRRVTDPRYPFKHRSLAHGGRRLVSYRLNGYAGRAFRSRARLDGETQIPPSRRSLPHPYGCGRSIDGEASAMTQP
jgi:hypothetical protein